MGVTYEWTIRLDEKMTRAVRFDEGGFWKNLWFCELDNLDYMMKRLDFHDMVVLDEGLRAQLLQENSILLTYNCRWTTPRH